MSNKTGYLINEKDLKIQRKWFIEAVKLLGVMVLYRSPLKNKHWTTYAEIDSNYAPPLKVGCIFSKFPAQRTQRKQGWNAELGTESIQIDVSIDLPELQIGALFILPSGLDDGKGRIFMVSKLHISTLYPAAITCELVPEYENALNKETLIENPNTGFNKLNEEDDSLQYLGEGDQLSTAVVDNNFLIDNFDDNPQYNPYNISVGVTNGYNWV